MKAHPKSIGRLKRFYFAHPAGDLRGQWMAWIAEHRRGLFPFVERAIVWINQRRRVSMPLGIAALRLKDERDAIPRGTVSCAGSLADNRVLPPSHCFIYEIFSLYNETNFPVRSPSRCRHPAPPQPAESQHRLRNPRVETCIINKMEYLFPPPYRPTII